MPRKETAYYRVVGRSENQGGQYFLVGIICPPVESVLTDLSESGGAMASPPPAPSRTTGLLGPSGLKISCLGCLRLLWNCYCYKQPRREKKKTKQPSYFFSFCVFFGLALALSVSSLNVRRYRAAAINFEQARLQFPRCVPTEAATFFSMKSRLLLDLPMTAAL